VKPSIDVLRGERPLSRIDDLRTPTISIDPLKSIQPKQRQPAHLALTLLCVSVEIEVLLFETAGTHIEQVFDPITTE